MTIQRFARAGVPAAAALLFTAGCAGAPDPPAPAASPVDLVTALGCDPQALPDPVVAYGDTPQEAIDAYAAAPPAGGSVQRYQGPDIAYSEPDALATYLVFTDGRGRGLAAVSAAGSRYAASTVRLCA